MMEDYSPVDDQTIPITCQFCQKKVWIYSLSKLQPLISDCTSADCPINADCQPKTMDCGEPASFAYQVKFVGADACEPVRKSGSQCVEAHGIAIG